MILVWVNVCQCCVALHYVIIDNTGFVARVHYFGKSFKLVCNVFHLYRMNSSTAIDVVHKIFNNKRCLAIVLDLLKFYCFLQVSLWQGTILRVCLNVFRSYLSLFGGKQLKVFASNLGIDATLSTWAEQTDGAIDKVKLTVVLGKFLKAEKHRLA